MIWKLAQFLFGFGNWRKIVNGVNSLQIVCPEIHRVRVANELGAGNGKAAKFATIVSVSYSTVIGLFFCVLILIVHDEFAYIFTSSTEVIQAVDKLSYLLGATILLNSVQPVLSGEFLHSNLSPSSVRKN